MTNYPTIDQTPPWAETNDQDVATFIQDYVTGDLYEESELCRDINLGRWFHKSMVEQYNNLCAFEFGWNEEERVENLKVLKSCL